MTPQFTIQELARQVRRGTLERLDAAPADRLTWAPPGTSNHILWHAGHALWLQGGLCLEPLTGNSQLPPDWEKTFGMNCRPVKQTSRWPSREELKELLSVQLDQIIAAIGTASESRLAEVVNPRGDTLAGRIIHGLHDEARHQGEMYLLLKLCRVSDI
jgi:DinB superfamily